MDLIAYGSGKNPYGFTTLLQTIYYYRVAWESNPDACLCFWSTLPGNAFPHAGNFRFVCRLITGKNFNGRFKFLNKLACPPLKNVFVRFRGINTQIDLVVDEDGINRRKLVIQNLPICVRFDIVEYVMSNTEIYLKGDFWKDYPRLHDTYLYLIGCTHELKLRQYGGFGLRQRNAVDIEDAGLDVHGTTSTVLTNGSYLFEKHFVKTSIFNVHDVNSEDMDLST